MLLLLLRPWFRRRGRALRLRALARRRIERTLSRLTPVGLRPIVGLSCRRTIRFRLSFGLACGRPVRLWPVRLWPVRFWLVRLWPVRLWLIRLGLVRSGCRRSVRFWLIVRHRPVRANGVVLWTRGRCASRWLNRSSIHRSVVRRPRWLRVHNCAIAESPGLGSSRNCGRAVVQRCPLLWVRAGSLFMLCLSSHRRDMSLTCH